MNDDNLKGLLIVAGALFFAFLLIPEIWLRLIGFLVCVSVLIYCIVMINRDNTTTIKAIVYLGLFIISALGAGKLVVYFAETLPAVGMIVTIALTIMSLIFLTVVVVKLGIWFYNQIKSTNNVGN